MYHIAQYHVAQNVCNAFISIPLMLIVQNAQCEKPTNAWGIQRQFMKPFRLRSITITITSSSTSSPP